MYKISEISHNRYFVEFPFLTTKRRKVRFLKNVLSTFYKEQTYIVGEINGLDFSVEQISKELETKNLILTSNQNGYSTLPFSNLEARDLLTVISNFDRWSEGYYIIYIYSKNDFKLSKAFIPLIDHHLENFLLKFSVHSDATLLDFEFCDELSCNKFLQIIR